MKVDIDSESTCYEFGIYDSGKTGRDVRRRKGEPVEEPSAVCSHGYPQDVCQQCK